MHGLLQLRLGEEHMLVYEGVVLDERQLLGHLPGVLPLHIEIPGVGRREELDQDGTLPLGHCAGCMVVRRKDRTKRNRVLEMWLGPTRSGS
jgi:hypothetical protein